MKKFSVALVSFYYLFSLIGFNLNAGDISRETLNINDVSILFPLPKQRNVDLLKLDDVGFGGQLLTKSVYDNVVGTLIGTITENLYPKIRIVSLRIDPCFESMDLGSEKCIKQIRIVGQPTVIDPGTANTTTLDGAIHLFYELTQNQFNQIIEGLKKLKKEVALDYSDTPLSVHPAMEAQGLEGSFYSGLKPLLLKNIGDQNLVKITFMRRGTAGDAWEFGGYDRTKNGDFKPFTIPVIGIENEFFSTRSMGVLGQRLIPRESTLGANIRGHFPVKFLRTSRIENLNNEEFLLGLQKLLRIENPTKFNSGTVDCVSCHVAGHTLKYVENYSGISTENDINRFNIPESVNGKLMDQTQSFPKSLRAFGYFLDLRAISQRTVNDSAVVVDFLNKN